MKTRNPLLLFVLIFIFMQVSCKSTEEIGLEKREQLLKVYTINVTTREEVAGRWSPLKPDISRNRPDSGWETAKEPFIANRLSSVERKTGKTVESVDRYFGSDGLLSLCRCWFFFDDSGRLIDLEWNYASD
jgi:hypothetical protein